MLVEDCAERHWQATLGRIQRGLEYLVSRSGHCLSQWQGQFLSANTLASAAAARLPLWTPPFMKPRKSVLVCSPANCRRPWSAGSASTSSSVVYCPVLALA